MSEKRSTQARSRSGQPQPISLSTNPDPASNLERAEMTGNDREIEISTLTFRQQASLPAIAFAPTITQAARDSGVGESTLRRWLQVPDFRQQLDHFRQESADLARQQAQILLPRCLSVFAEAMDSPDLSLPLRAARLCHVFRPRILRSPDPQGQPAGTRRSHPNHQRRLSTQVERVMYTSGYATAAKAAIQAALHPFSYRT